MEPNVSSPGPARPRHRGNVPVDKDAILQTLFRAGLGHVSTVVLVGSAARDTRTSCSDVDVLVLDEEGTRLTLARPGDTHLQQDSRSRFLKRLNDGDDYPAWALRLGVPLRDADGWWAKQCALERSKPHWPDWRPKVDYARKRLTFAAELLKTGDVDASAEELLLATSHIARAVLLRAGEFPLSRPELPHQLQGLDTDLAEQLRELIFGDAHAGALKCMMSLLRARLAELAAVRDADG